MNLRDYCKSVVDDLKSKNLDWKIRVLEAPSGARTVINGKSVILLCANNYLGLANHPRLKKAAIEATRAFGAGAGAVPVIAGTMRPHVELQETIAKFKECEAALYTQTGFAANQGIIPALLQEGDLVISDELNHGSIIDGVRLSKAERKVYKHKNMQELETHLKESHGKYKKILVITDGVFSMDGDIAPMKQIVELCERYGAISYVDDAHGDGVLGDGRGIVRHFNLQKRVDVEVGTFSKGFGVVGGYVCGSQELVEFCRNKSRSYLLSGAATPGTVAACKASLELIMEKPQIVEKLWRNTNYFKRRLKTLGFNTGESETPIIPVMLGDSAVAQKFASRLLEEGVFSVPIFYPMVAQGKARIRAQISAAHGKDELDEALAAFEKVGKELKAI